MRQTLLSKTVACRPRPTSTFRSRESRPHTLRARRTHTTDAQTKPPTQTKGSNEGTAKVGNKSIEEGSVGPTEASKSTKEPAHTTPVPASTPAVRSVSVTRKFADIIVASPIGRLGRQYARVQERRPYVTQLSSSLVVYLCGDLSAQLLFPSDAPSSPNQRDPDQGKGSETKQEDATVSQKKAAGYDPLRTLRHLTVGAISSIPSYKWFMFLDRNFNFSSKALSILTKVAVQQACFTPVFNTYFFSMQSLLTGASLAETWERLKRAVPSSIVNSLKLWPAVTAISFMYVPAQFRAVFGGTVAVGWQTYLSWLNQKAAKEVAAREAATADAAAAPSIAPPQTIDPGRKLAIG